MMLKITWLQADGLKPTRAASGRLGAAGKDYKERSAFLDRGADNSVAVQEGRTAATEAQAVKEISKADGALPLQLSPPCFRCRSFDCPPVPANDTG